MSKRTSSQVIHLHPDDNICVAATNLEAQTQLEVGPRTVGLSEPVRLGHKIAVAPIAKGDPVRKYGQTIGFATEPIETGDWVHCHNLSIGELVPDHASATQIPADLPAIADRTFLGYRRPGGKAGTRNYVAVISTVNCSASVSRYVADRFDRSALKDYPGVDGVVSFSHDSGCGMAFGSQKHHMLNRVMGGIARHPNIGAYLLIGLGCEQGAMGYLIEQERLVQIDGFPSQTESKAPLVLSMQDVGGTAKTVERAVEMVAELLPRASDVKREPIGADKIVLGTECGGSDGNSGVTANPALGVASDMIVRCGGTTILAETPEIFGADHLLTRRSVTKEVAQKLIDRIKWWHWYTGLYGAQLDNNPSVGNKEGGLSTIAEKSLGAVAKGGSTRLVDVYEYAEPVTAKGLVVMDTPGFDAASVTGMVAGGANVVVFTTGRGSCFGCKPVPSIKIASNTPMYERMEDDMDIDAGTILAGRSVEQVGSEIFEEILAVASGKQTKSEAHGIGEEEFIPWTVGPTL